MKKILYKFVFSMVLIISFFICTNIVKATDENIVLVLDAGHGGRDPGAQNTELRLNECDLNIKIARYLRDYLNEYDGVTVLMTHNGIASGDYLELVDRGMYARNNNADMLISLHLNANNISLLYGAEIYVTANTSLEKYNKNSTKLANSILNQLSKLGIYNRGVKTRLSDEPGDKYTYSDGTIADYYGVIRYPMKGDSEGLGVDIAKGEGIPGIIIEHCFIRGNDTQFIDSEEDLKKLAKADCDGIVEYYGLRKKEDVVKSVSIDKTNVILSKEEKTKLTATVSPNTALNKNVTWKSSNEEVVTVDNKGNITAVGIGRAVITVATEDNKKTAETIVIVNNIIEDQENQEIIINNLKNENGILSRIAEKTLKKDFIKNFELTDNVSIEIKDCNDYITTNTIVEIKNKETKEILNRFYCIIYGDINKDGKVTSGDYVLIKNHIMETNRLSVEVIDAADVNRDGKVSSGDYVLIKNHIMNGTELKIE